MGNSESSNPIRNMDKRTARREYGETFANAIVAYRNKNVKKKKIQSAIISQDKEWTDGSIRVYVRKRPIFKHETDKFEFDVATCVDDKTIVIHDARMHADMKRQIMSHYSFEFDTVFNEATSNEYVYENSAKSLVDITLNGGFSTALVYGQTGSGKTFTMTSIYEKAARDIFSQLHEVTDRFSAPPVVTMSFIEIAGDRCSDLLNGFEPAQLLTSVDGSVHPFPVVEPIVDCAEALMAMISHGMNIRTTAATGVHDASSRSHAILRIYVNRSDLVIKGQEDSSGSVEGTLTLVDLAGSEHRIDSMFHGKERRKETGNINASLMALKECIRARAAGKNLSHQYRKSKLTMALKTSFSLPSARTIVIATVSPASKDTEHSLNTLRHACIMHGQQDSHSNHGAQAGGGGNDEETRFVTGGKVVVEQIGEVNLTAMARRNKQIKKEGGVLDGPKTSNGNAVDSSKKAKDANKEIEITEKEKEKLKRQVERRSFAKLEPQHKELLNYHRAQLGNEFRQLARMRRAATDMSQGVVARDAIGIEEEEVDEGDGEQDYENHDNRDQDHYDDNYNYENGVPEEEMEFYSSLKSAIPEELEQEENEDDECDIENFVVNTKQKVNRNAGAGNGRQNNDRGADYSRSNRQLESPPQSPPPPPPNANPANKQARNTGRPQQPKAPHDSRVAFQSIYDSIYTTETVNAVPENILRKQLISLLSLHGYSADETVELILEHQMGVNQGRSGGSGQDRRNIAKVSPRGGDVEDGTDEVEIQTARRAQPQNQQQMDESYSDGLRDGLTDLVHSELHSNNNNHNHANLSNQPARSRASIGGGGSQSVKSTSFNSGVSAGSVNGGGVKNSLIKRTNSANSSASTNGGSNTTRQASSRPSNTSEPPVVTIAGKPAKHFKSRFDEDDETEDAYNAANSGMSYPKVGSSGGSASRSKTSTARQSSGGARGQQTLAEQTRAMEQDAAEDKERRRLAGLEAARIALEEQAALRKQRQDAAKALREQQNNARLAKARSGGKQVTSPQEDRHNDSYSPRSNLNSHLDPNSNEFHNAEITRLSREIESASASGGVSSTTLFGIRKKIAVHKAAILKAQRMVEAQQQQARRNGADVAVGGGGGGGGDEAETAESEEQQDLQYKRRAADKSRYSRPAVTAAPVVQSPPPPAPVVEPPYGARASSQSQHEHWQQQQQRQQYSDDAYGYDGRGQQIQQTHPQQQQQQQQQQQREQPMSEYQRFLAQQNDLAQYQQQQQQSQPRSLSDYSRNNSGPAYAQDHQQYKQQLYADHTAAAASAYDRPSSGRNRPQQQQQPPYQVDYPLGGGVGGDNSRRGFGQDQTMYQSASHAAYQDIPTYAQQQQQQQQGGGGGGANDITPTRGGGGGRYAARRVVGASAAPFANDYSWNTAGGGEGDDVGGNGN